MNIWIKPIGLLESHACARSLDVVFCFDEAKETSVSPTTPIELFTQLHTHWMCRLTHWPLWDVAVIVKEWFTSRVIAWALSVKFLSYESHRTLLMSRHSWGQHGPHVDPMILVIKVVSSNGVVLPGNYSTAWGFRYVDLQVSVVVNDSDDAIQAAEEVSINLTWQMNTCHSSMYQLSTSFSGANILRMASGMPCMNNYSLLTYYLVINTYIKAQNK